MGASPRPPEDPAARLLSLIERVRAAVAKGDGAAAAAAVQPLLRTACGPAVVIEILGAALDLDHAGFLQAAASLAIVTDLPANRRIHIAWRLAIAGFVDHALAALTSDPRMFGDPAVTDQTLNVLQRIQARAAPGSITRTQAAALSRRLLPTEAPPAIPSDRSFAGNALAAPLARGAPVAIHAAAGVPPVIRTEVVNVLTAFDRGLAHVRHPTVAVYPDVFVNRLGQIWGRDGRMFRTFGRLVAPASRLAEASAPVVEEAALAVEMHNNIFHWFAEWFPTLAWRLDAAGDAMPVLVRDDAAHFVAESLRLAARGPVGIIGAGDAVFVRRLHVAPQDLSLLARPEAVGGALDRLRDRAAAQAALPAGSRPLYISRRDSDKRRMVNELDLEAALQSRGFEIAIMSQLPLAEQIARVSRAGTIVAAHGAGLALLAAAQPGRRVLEIMPTLRGGMTMRSCMAKISRLVGHEHHLWLEQANGSGWTLTLEPFLAMLDALPRAAALVPQSCGTQAP
ncbi:glycosyltransferase family 61 protein [Roseomonas sp. CAU 1739]|uniref:glycosyltransferase family 61 protein n=1 Tax=Roseomonas sp. CAU 1739 TaxID=3140364 RepID=UPI00325BBBB5